MSICDHRSLGIVLEPAGLEFQKSTHGSYPDRNVPPDVIHRCHTSFLKELISPVGRANLLSKSHCLTDRRMKWLPEVIGMLAVVVPFGPGVPWETPTVVHGLPVSVGEVSTA